MLQASTAVEFYEKGNQTLMKIMVQDDNGYDRSRQSSNATVPVTKGVYNNFYVPINSFDRNVNNVRTNIREQSASLEDLYHFRQLRNFIESSKAVQYLVESDAHTEWFDHTAVLYARYSSDILLTKSCQLQVYLVNTGKSRRAGD